MSISEADSPEVVITCDTKEKITTNRRRRYSRRLCKQVANAEKMQFSSQEPITWFGQCRTGTLGSRDWTSRLLLQAESNTRNVPSTNLIHICIKLTIMIKSLFYLNLDQYYLFSLHLVRAAKKQFHTQATSSHPIISPSGNLRRLHL